MQTKYQWENLNHPKLTQLKNKYNQNKVIAEGENEFKQQILLKDWVHKTLPDGNPSKDYSKNQL